MVDKALKTNIKVEDLMIANVIKITPKMKLFEVAELFIAKKISGAPVVDESGHVISIVGEGALLELLARHGMESTVAHGLVDLTPDFKLLTLKKEDSFSEAYKLFLKHKIHRIPVVDSNRKLIGMISRGSVFRMVVEAHYGKKIP